MSSRPRPRTRPTRDETKAKLLDAAAAVFATRGIGATSIEDVCTAAGFSRGAFYSNFDSKDDLVFELLDFHFESNQQETHRLFDESANTADFINRLSSSERQQNLKVDDVGRLTLELTLHALRNPDNRDRLISQQRRNVDLFGAAVQRIIDQDGIGYPLSVDDIAHFLLAFDTGLLLMALVDPERSDSERWNRVVIALHQLVTRPL